MVVAAVNVHSSNLRNALNALHDALKVAPFHVMSLIKVDLV